MRLSEVFASRVQARVLEELLNAPHTIFTQVELARRVGCSSSSVDRALKNLLRLGLIRIERLSANKIVALNLNSRVVSLLIQFNRDVKKAETVKPG
ncbi:MAG: helix-turn-helix domain-containing protein [Thermoproteota archaeon]|nr:MarR family transcriptional regulator [Candidatus Brockarchaeota archaeon]